MTELEQARAHLQKCQRDLAVIRALLANNKTRKSQSLKEAHRVKVLCALSWVWDAQERAGFNPPWIIKAGFIDPKFVEAMKTYHIIIDRTDDPPFAEGYAA